MFGFVCERSKLTARNRPVLNGDLAWAVEDDGLHCGLLSHDLDFVVISQQNGAFVV